MSNFEMIFECHIICQTAEMATPSHSHSPFWKHLDLEGLEQIGKSKMRKAVPDSTAGEKIQQTSRVMPVAPVDIAENSHTIDAGNGDIDRLSKVDLR